MITKKLHKPEITKAYLKDGHVHIIEAVKYARYPEHHVFASLEVIEQHFGTDYRKECETAIKVS